MLLAGCVALAGCRHKPVAVVVPVAPPVPVALEKPPEPATPPLLARVPLQAPPTPAVKVPPKKVKKPKKKPVVVVPGPVAPVQVASAGPVPESASVIGALTAGGDAAPGQKQRAIGLIGELDKRLAGLPAEVQEKQREGLVRVRYFEREARTALDAGDGDGAVTLVTKARLLLDDLVK